MTDQLVLIDSLPSWRMDSPTRELGIRGVARARQALQDARSRIVGADTDGDVEIDGEVDDVLAPAA
jgi:hypothetical protein